MLQGSAVPSTLRDETDADLLCWMSMKAEDSGQADEAWAEFYSRHVSDLYGFCRNRLRLYGLREDEAVDLTQNTFIRAYEKAGSFKAPPEKRGPDHDRA